MRYADLDSIVAPVRTRQTPTTRGKSPVRSPNDIKNLILSALPDFRERSFADLGIREIIEICSLLSDTADNVLINGNRHDKASELYEAAGYIALGGDMKKKASEFYSAAADHAANAGDRYRRDAMLQEVVGIQERKGDAEMGKNGFHSAHHAYEKALVAIRTIDEDGSVSSTELRLLSKYRDSYKVIRRTELGERDPHAMQFLGELNEAISRLDDMTQAKR